MLKAEGTREEWKNYFRESKNDFIDCKRYSLEESLLVVAESRGWITKPEWEQAYDEYSKLYEQSYPFNDYPQKEKIIERGAITITAMHNYIIELEKIVRAGK